MTINYYEFMKQVKEWNKPMKKNNHQKQRNDFKKLKEHLDKTGYVYGNKHTEDFVHIYELSDHNHRISEVLKIFKR